MKKENYKNIQYFLIPYFGVAFGLLVCILTIPKEELHLMMVEHRSLTADWFFRVWTEAGGIALYFFILFFVFFRYRTAFFLFASETLGLLIAWIAKNIYHAPRPSLYFKEFYPELTLPVIPGFNLMDINSFPSGHTVNSFAFFFALALIAQNKWAKLLCFFAAALVAYSRIYLSQHFAIDVLTGSLIGIISAWMIYPYYLKLGNKWKDHSLSDYFHRKNQHNLAEN